MKKRLFGCCVIADKKGRIIFMSEDIQELLNSEDLDKLMFYDVKTLLKPYGFDLLQTNRDQILWINDNLDGGVLSSILSSSFDELFVCDNKGRSIYCNTAFEANYGIPSSAIIGKPVTELVARGCMDRTLTPQIINSKKALTYEQHTSTGKTILVTAVPILDSDGEVSMLVENCRDTTEINKLKNNFSQTKLQINTLSTCSEFKHHLNCEPQFVSRQMKEIYKIIENMSIRDVTIMLLGESGTGKSTLARCIYQKSHRAEGSFISINCSTIPEALIESELFGYEKGAFTGASSAGKPGLIEAADKGTLFLDEIGELSLAMQVKLLELIQDHTYLPVGGTKKKYLDARFIVATNRNLYKMVEEKKFREDLFYRLSVVTIVIPPLRDRPEDIEVLLNYYMDTFNSKHNLNVKLLGGVKNILLNYSFPGNIRELENLIEFLILNSYDDIHIKSDSLPSNIVADSNNTINKNMVHMTRKTNLAELLDKEEERIVQKYYKYNNSSYKLAKVLSISQSKAYRLIQKYIHTTSE